MDGRIGMEEREGQLDGWMDGWMGGWRDWNVGMEGRLDGGIDE